MKRKTEGTHPDPRFPKASEKGQGFYRILVTNDDGVESQGLWALAAALETIADDVWVLAPDRDQSAISHALSLNRPLRVKRVGGRGPQCLALNGTPSDCVLLGVKKILPQPVHLIASGINKGENLGEDISYSGTVSAAIEAAILGIPSFAISLVGRKDFAFDHAASFAARLARNILMQGLPRHTFLNVNVPSQEKAPLSYRITRMGKRIYGDSVQEKKDRRGRRYFIIGGNSPGFMETRDSDFEAIGQKYISITPLHLDWTNYASFESLLKRRF